MNLKDIVSRLFSKYIRANAQKEDATPLSMERYESEPEEIDDTIRQLIKEGVSTIGAEGQFRMGLSCYKAITDEDLMVRPDYAYHWLLWAQAQFNASMEQDSNNYRACYYHGLCAERIGDSIVAKEGEKFNPRSFNYQIAIESLKKVLERYQGNDLVEGAEYEIALGRACVKLALDFESPEYDGPRRLHLEHLAKTGRKMALGSTGPEEYQYSPHKLFQMAYQHLHKGIEILKTSGKEVDQTILGFRDLAFKKI